MKINELCQGERPREKFLSRGASALGDSELLAILLHTGTADHSAVDLGNILLNDAEGSLTRLSQYNFERLKRFSGIGPGKAVTLMAAFELGRRFMAERPRGGGRSIVEAGQVYGIMGPLLKGCMHEECWVLFLGPSQSLIGKERISTGGMTSTTMDYRSIVAKCLDRGACHIIMVHNHPSGSARPSNADIECTKALRKAVQTFDITLLDHIVIGEGCYYSFADDEMVTVR